MGSPKQIIYRYNGDALSDEAETDRQGKLPVPEKDKIIQRDGRDWKVVSVVLEQTVGDSKALPVYYAFLSDEF